MKLDASDIADLRPVIEAAVASTIEKLRETELAQSNRIGYLEHEAAALLGLQRHVLRDARLRGEVKASRIGKKTVYERGELLRFLERQRI